MTQRKGEKDKRPQHREVKLNVGENNHFAFGQVVLLSQGVHGYRANHR